MTLAIRKILIVLFTVGILVGVVALIIMLVFFAQMGIAWMLRKPVEAVRW